jgi:hypothetical protein
LQALWPLRVKRVHAMENEQCYGGKTSLSALGRDSRKEPLIGGEPSIRENVWNVLLTVAEEEGFEPPRPFRV